MDDLTREFVAEAREGLDRMERCLTELETHPHDRTLIDNIFRAVHTIKGATGFLGFARLEALAHAGENLLSSLRGGKIQVNAELISGLLELLDSLRSVLRLIELTGGEGQRRTDEDFATISRLIELNEAGMVAAALARVVADSGLHQNSLPEAPPSETAVPLAEAADGIERRVSVQPADRTLRVDVEVLNRLMNHVGELVLARNQFLTLTGDDERLSGLGRRLDTLTSDLRETVMRLRLQPIGYLFGKFPRLVRDLAHGCGKQVRLEVEGQDTGLDKTLLEAIRDPLTHALRNAIDHGIESPRNRVLAGKSPEGLIRLRAFQQNGSVIVEIQDDGAGINGAAIAAQAVERGLVTAGRAAAMSDWERCRLIFAPGLSTAAEVTNLSGRGVGMDVVRANVESHGGSVHLESAVGAGTTVRLTLPLTLAILPALIVRSAGQSFALPQSAIRELVHIPNGELERTMERIGEAELYRTRDGLIPVLRLTALMELKQDRCAMSGFHMALIETEGCRLGLLIDELVAPEEIVVKPISPVLRSLELFSGAALLGCGDLAFVLDVGGLRARAGLQPNSDGFAPQARGELLRPIPRHTDSVLVYEVCTSRDGAPETRFIALSSVERIATIASGQIESISGRTVLRIDRDLLNVTDETHALESGGAELTAIVCLHDGRRRAILVNRVLKVCDRPVSLQGTEERFAVIDDRLAMRNDTEPACPIVGVA